MNRRLAALALGPVAACGLHIGGDPTGGSPADGRVPDAPTRDARALDASPLDALAVDAPVEIDALPPVVPSVRISYLADQELDGVSEAFVFDQGVPVRVHDAGMRVMAQFWAPDGSALALHAAETADDSEVFVVDLSGGPPWDAVRAHPPVHNGASYPAWSPDSQRLAFLSDHEDAGVYELYVHHVRGEHAGELWKINGPLAIDRDVTSFRWSPTGSSIAYRALEDDDWDLYIADVGGDAPTPAVRVNGGIAPVEEDEELWERTGYRFAPDGQSIFFIAPQSSPWVGRELFWVDLRGGSPAAPVRIRPPEAPWNVERAGWSPDGRWILYSSNATLFLVEMIPTPSPAIQISGTEFPGGAWANTFPEWSPDSTQIAYQADSPDPGDAYHLFVVDVTDESPSPPRQINGPLLPGESLPDNGIGRRSFAWSADGDLLAYVSREQGLVALRFVDTSAPLPWQATVASQPSARDVTPYQLRFAPADRRLVYRAEETPGVWELFVVDLGSGGPHEPTRVNAPLTLAGSVEIELVSRPVHAWDPTGAFIAYRADQAVNERFELWVVDASLPGFSSPVNGPLVPAGDVHGFAWAPTAGPP